jgi:CBS domain-containing protein
MSETSTIDSQPIQHIYRGHGTRTERPLGCADPDPDVVRVPTIADLIPVTQIMSRRITCAGRDLDVARLVELVVRNRIGCVPVVEDAGRPVGMVTKLDLVEQMLANDRGESDSPSARDLVPCTVGELMMPLAITLGERATVAHAAALMASEDVHHVPICDATGRMIGIVSTMDIVRWLARNDGFVPPVAPKAE